MTIHDAGEQDGLQYLVAEYMEGGTLNDWAKAEQRRWQQVVELLAGVADGLAAAHDAGIVHRDVKPGNILIHRSGCAKLADFGLAQLAEGPAARDANSKTKERLTYRDLMIGTIAYMSPEHASGNPVDARSDVSSFGVVLYEMLAGRRPFEGATNLEVLQRIIHDPARPMREEIPLVLRRVVAKALEKDPAERYQSMGEIDVDLRRCARQNGEAPTARPARSGAFRRTVAAAAVALTFISAAVAVFRSRPAIS